MTFRKLFPYILITIFFSFLYWVTTVISDNNLHLIFGETWGEAFTKRKSLLHMIIFVCVLPFVISGINLLEAITTKQDKFPLRLIKSMLTILLTNAVALLIYILLDIKTCNWFYDYRGIPASIGILAAILTTLMGLLIVEFIKNSINKTLLIKYIPVWLWFEKK